MKKIILLLFAFTSVISVYSQNNLLDGDNCFDNGDYACAVTNYNNAFKSASGKDKQLAEIRLTRAKWCDEHLKTANQAFSGKNYTTAKDEYQKVLDSNSKDSYAQSQVLKCDKALETPKLRKATTAELTDIWNNIYGVQPQRRQILINAGIDPDDAQKRINSGEGKPQEKETVIQETNLSVSKSTIYFTSYGETSERINVYSNVNTFTVPSGYVPSWCTVNTNSGYFTVTASANPNYSSRKDWFKVIADGKEVRINVEQLARTSPYTKQASIPTNQTTQSNAKKCFNCPFEKYTLGFTLGYVDKNDPNYYEEFNMQGFQVGFRIEPLFKYGFGINTGIFYEFFSSTLNESLFYNNNYNDDFEQHVISIPLHLEYRLNFSKYFNVFAYGGGGFDLVMDAFNYNNNFIPSFEFGGGLRIDHFQFNIGQSLQVTQIDDINDFKYLYSYKYKGLILSVSYMF